MDGLRLRHRYAIALPFLALIVVILIGGTLNSIDAHGRVIDDLTDKPVKDTRVTHGVRSVVTDVNGEFTFPAVPRTSKFAVEAQGYLRQPVATTAEEVRLKPLSVTLYAYDATKTPDDRVKSPQARDPQNPGKILASGNESGQIIVAPHPGKDAKVLICGKDFESKVVTVEGVLMQIGLTPAPGSDCPPIPAPSPAPGTRPSPTAPAPSPTSTP